MCKATKKDPKHIRKSIFRQMIERMAACQDYHGERRSGVIQCEANTSGDEKNPNFYKKLFLLLLNY